MQVHEFGSGAFPILAKTDRSGLEDCVGKDCPTVYGAEGDDILIQGYETSLLFRENSIPDGERVVRIPRGLLRQLVANGEL
ncbi:hypothetical protein AXFE_21680 [Acidithrix ferrooxidans]|uniref:Uncharacterized protein n=2 Tax=Acidithrix ferrooxidans TaxID=1280514 RepID=A0A0D8HIR6_9ACTN|nr:hypothetical protein AXFE_21680 [Acidithrix ferrooxidans]